MTWKFKLRVTVGRAAVHNAKSIKLVNDIDLHHTPVDKENAPMLIVGFGKTFTVHDQAPKKLIMRTLARAAMETDKALEEEDMYWLKGENGPQAPNKVSGTGTIMRVHASPSLNKKAESIDSSDMSPRRAGGQRSPQSNTVQDTDDRIPKESVYGTIRPKTKSIAEPDDVDCLPPPPQEGFEESRQPLLAPPKPAPRMVYGQEGLDAHTPRSNRSIDSGLPDSSSTTSSTSPPGQQQNDTAAHRKSSSLDNINLPGDPSRPGWKSYSLQRGVAPPTEEEAARLKAETLVIMRNGGPSLPGPTPTTVVTEEDPYGRCTNMRLTSFTEATANQSPRDPRIIDLAQSTALTQQMTGQSLPPHTQPQYPNSNFNTMPAQGIGGQHPHASPQLAHHPHNTLPARVGESPPRTGLTNYPGHPPNLQPTGRHFKPFDHRKMNPMAEIQENPYELQASMEQQYRTEPTHNGVADHINGHGSENTYVVHHNTHIPHMPSELRHTNYGTKAHLVHPQQVMQHRDSANYSLASSDSG